MVRWAFSWNYFYFCMKTKVQQLKVKSEYFYIFMDVTRGVGCDNIAWLVTICNEVHDLNLFTDFLDLIIFLIKTFSVKTSECL